MTDHYFTQDPSADHEYREFTATLRGMSFTFTTDANVFSRDRVDFGSALLIEVMRLPATGNVLDLGCGYGPIGIAAAKLAPGAQIHMVDVNQRAADLARRNAERNGASNVEIHSGDGLSPVRAVSFDLVLTNPPIRAGKKVIYAMIDEAKEALRPGGSLWVVIQTKQGAPSMKKKLKETFGNVDDVDRKAGYHVLVAVKSGD